MNTSAADRLERAMEAAMRPGEFIPDRRSWGFVGGLEKVAADVASLIDEGRSERAAAIFEDFIAAAYEKAAEIDDSSGDFGVFVQDLLCNWARARQAAKENSEETAARLMGWVDADDYSFCYGLERKLVKVLDEVVLRAYAALIRARLDAPPPNAEDVLAEITRKRWTDALKCCLAEQGDVEAYVALAEETSITSDDCRTVAEVHQRRGRPVEALDWVERGLALAQEESHGGAERELQNQRRALLQQLGRGGEAVASAWAEFERSPSTLTYDTLMEIIPEADRSAWHDKAMAATEQGALPLAINLLVREGETKRLAARIGRATDRELEWQCHFTLEPVAEMLAPGHPALAARVFRALGLHIVNRKKSRRYDAAIHSFERARDCYLEAGQKPSWDELVVQVRRDHGRKYGFMPDFERLAAGSPPAEPSGSSPERVRRRGPRGETRRGREN